MVRLLPSSVIPDRTGSPTTLQELVKEVDGILNVMDTETIEWDVIEPIVAEMRTLPAKAFEPLSALQHGTTDGQRLAAIIRLEQNPDSGHIPWLEQRLAVEGPLLERYAALAFEAAARKLDAASQPQVLQAITRGRQELRPSVFGTEINEILRQAQLISVKRMEPGHDSDSAARAARAALAALARRYDEMRATMPSSNQRTLALERLVTEMRHVAPVSREIIAELAESSSAGDRLTAVVMLQETPDLTFLPWLASRLGQERHFIGYHAAVALSDAADALGPQHLQAFEETLQVAGLGARRSRDPNQRTVLDHVAECLAQWRRQVPEAQRAYEERLAEARQQLRALAQQYQRLRRQTLRTGSPRPNRMERIAEQMQAYADWAYALLPDLIHSYEPGEQLAAMTFLEARPHPDYLDWLVKRLDNEAPFEQWHAAVALIAAAQQFAVTQPLTPEFALEVRSALQKAHAWLGAGPATEDYRNKLTEAETLLQHLAPDLHARAEDTESAVAAAQQPDVLHTSPHKWVLVAGLGTYELPIKVLETSERLGEMLAKEGYGLIVGGWQGVDHVVARQFMEVLTQFGRSDQEFLVQVTGPRGPDYPKGQIIRTPTYEEQLTEGITRADVIVLISGKGGTFHVGETARRMAKPVFPLADTDGDSREVYRSILDTWDRKPTRGISKEEFTGLNAPAPQVVDYLRELIKKSVAGENISSLSRDPNGVTEGISDELRRLARDYLNISISDWNARVHAKNELAVQMGRYVIMQQVCRDTLAREANQGLLLALAEAVREEPENGDLSRLLEASEKI
jgi:hypothetical protein